MCKIVITGALGYIGTELCKLYSGEARFKKIIAIDNRFVSERVKQLTDWGIEFVQANITDEKLISNLIEDADIIFHLAGVTDVAYTKTQSNDVKDQEIKLYGQDATRILINNTPKNCKFIFPSTHVVYEGLTETKFEIGESEPTKSVLSYASGKVQSEEDLSKSELDYIILRLATVYGYSTDTMRMNIMPNLFSKITALNGTISLFSGGVQHKSLVSLLDVVRAMKFLAESKYSREIFHISNENLTIKEVAQICKKYNDKVNIIETSDEIPNLGYTISSRKLISTGFKFLYNIDASIKEMVENWKIKEYPEDLEFIINGEKEFIDDRGKISNYELTEPINLIGYIESKTGSVRANHYHPIQEQKCLLIKGRYVSVIKDLSYPNAPIQTRLINEGEIAVIRPNVAHTMVFLEDSIFLNLVRGEREHENYGITHTVPYVLVDENFRKEILTNYSRIDRASGSKNLKPVLSLGLSPLANNLLNNVDEVSKLYPLEITYCPDSHNCQLSFNVPSSEMFDEYLYVSSTAKSFRDHFENAAINYVDRFNLNEDSFIVDIGSNDGIALKPFKSNNIRVLGVEPAKNISKIAQEQGIDTICQYFTKETAELISRDYGKADIVMASNVFAHADNLSEIALGVFEILKDGGVFIIEVQYLLDTIKDLTFDNIYHEHFNYWTVTSLDFFFKKLNLFITDVEHINTHGGSIRIFVENSETNKKLSVDHFLQYEEEFGIKNYQTYLDFSKRVNEIRENVRFNFNKLKMEGNKIVGFGSPAKATTALNFFGIDNRFIDYVVEDNKLKIDKLIPGVKIPIYSSSKLREEKVDIVVVLAWNFFEDIKKNNNDLIERGVKFISIKELQKKNISDFEKYQKLFN